MTGADANCVSSRRLPDPMMVQVKVVIAEGDDMLAIKISDQGGGIPPEVNLIPSVPYDSSRSFAALCVHNALAHASLVRACVASCCCSWSADSLFMALHCCASWHAGPMNEAVSPGNELVNLT